MHCLKWARAHTRQACTHSHKKKSQAVFLPFALPCHSPPPPKLLHVAIRRDRSPVLPNSSLMTSLNCVVRLMIVLPICQPRNVWALGMPHFYLWINWTLTMLHPFCPYSPHGSQGSQSQSAPWAGAYGPFYATDLKTLLLLEPFSGTWVFFVGDLRLTHLHHVQSGLHVPFY